MESIKSSINATIEAIAGRPSIVLLSTDEALTRKCNELLREAGYDVVLCTTEASPSSMAVFEVQHVHHQAILLVSSFSDDVNVLELLQKFNDAEKPIAATSAGISTLSHADFSRGKKMVRVEGISDAIQVVDGESVVRDGRLVTGTDVASVVKVLDDIYRGR